MTSWLAVRKSLVQKIRKQIRVRYGHESESLQGYSKAYSDDLNNKCVPTDYEHLLEELAVTEIVYGGDFHAFRQSIKSHCRLLQMISPSRKVVLALEIFQKIHQNSVDLYVSGQLGEDDFLKKVNWNKNWGFPWDIYRPLIELCRKNNWRVLALNISSRSRSEVGLTIRDEFAAEILAESLSSIKNQTEKALHYVIIGELHIAKQHLPMQVSLLRKNTVGFSLFLNPEDLYFQLHKKLQIVPEIVKIQSRGYALLTSPPWVKWQSYLMYLEESFEDDYEDGRNFADHLFELIKVLAHDLGASEFSLCPDIFDHEHPIATSRLKNFNKTERRILAQLVDLNENFFCVETMFAFVSNKSVNRTAEIAGQVLHAYLSKRTKSVFTKDQFLSLIWIEAIGYFLSKFINPNRKPRNLQDFRAHLVAFNEKISKDSMALALQQKMCEMVFIQTDKMIRIQFKSRHKVSYILSSKLLGESLGEKIFDGYKTGLFPLEYLKELLAIQPGDRHFDRFYWKFIKNLIHHEQLEEEEFLG